MIPPIAASFEPDALAGGLRKSPDHGRADRLVTGAVEHGFGPLGVQFGLVADDLEADYAFLEGRIVQIGHACLDGVVEPFQPQLRFGRSPVQFGDMLAAALRLLLPATQNGGKRLFQPVGFQQTLLDMAGDDAVQLVHGDRTALAAGLALPGLDRAGVVAIATALAGADGHRAAAVAAVTDAGQQGRPQDDTRRLFRLGVTGLQERLHRVEDFAVDQRRHRDGDNLGGGLQLLGLGSLVELVLADIGAPGQDAVNLPYAPAAAVAGEDAASVEMLDDSLDAHLAGFAIPFQREPIDEADRLGVQRVDLQLLLDLGAALLGRDDAVADRRQRAVPEALSRVLLQRSQDVLGVLLGLILVEQRHDLAHHDVHRIVAHLLGDGDELHAVLGELPDVELQLEVIAEEAAERMNHQHVERRGLGRTRLDHALELGPAVVRG